MKNEELKADGSITEMHYIVPLRYSRVRFRL
ncbi:MAG: hypothetical protein A4E46_01229 [Methanosaeta sp. PtaU1.Bin016]|nr:MAG: hypothetical protein A4E46_01229 [Methanosaeta sp. PtaU1.Bin016]